MLLVLSIFQESALQRREIHMMGTHTPSHFIIALIMTDDGSSNTHRNDFTMTLYPISLPQKPRTISAFEHGRSVTDPSRMSSAS